MAMIECPECDQGISDVATKCPHCGAPTAHGQVAFIKSFFITIGIVVFLIAMVMVT